MGGRLACPFIVWSHVGILTEESNAMFTEPQSLTKTGGSSQSLDRTSSADNAGKFRTADSALQMDFSHSYGSKRDRHTLRIVDTKTTADPLVTGSSFIASATVSIAIDVPKVGYTPTEQNAIVGALTTWLAASSGANPLKMIGGQS